MKKMIAIAALGLFALPAMASAQGLIGQCADCHTMHNSEEGRPVAQVWNSETASSDTSVAPVQNLLRMDCISCHAQGGSEHIVTLEGGSKVPQVYHSGTTDLAAGNFMHILEGNRKGHNVVDIFGAGDPDFGGLTVPPGDFRGGYVDPETGAAMGNTHANYMGLQFANFTCAGAAGCHGTRSQLLSSVPDPDNEGQNITVKRRGIPAVSGAHHQNYDGLKDPEQITAGVHDGQYIADSYRFIAGLKGIGNTEARWQNVDSTSHNEYFGADSEFRIASCNSCHVPGSDTSGISARMTLDSTLKIANQSMSNFCATCHGNFHSSGDGGNNGVSGAFLRHPSDYVIPDASEYAAYTVYDITAPVARPDLSDLPAASVVRPGTDMVMCLSCHAAHATPHDGMLRFNYADMVAGNTEGVSGCLACHTTKGVPKN